MSIDVKTTGKVFLSGQDASLFVRSLVNALTGSVSFTLDNKIDDLAKDIKSSYETQTLPSGGFPADYNLTDEYRIRKIKEGFDERIGIKTSSFVNSIKPYKISSNKWFVGTRKAYKSGDKPGRNRKMRLPAYARILEYGSRKQKARPVFRPNLRAFIPKYRQEVLKNMNNRIKSVIKSYGG